MGLHNVLSPAPHLPLNMGRAATTYRLSNAAPRAAPPHLHRWGAKHDPSSDNPASRQERTNRREKLKLIRARVQNYRSVEDSGEFEIGDLTCLVGKNEAGKTALLSAIRALDPVHPFEYDEIRDYPRRFSTRFDERHPDGQAEVVRTWWQLEEADLKAVEAAFGPEVVVQQ